jgi:hypothetical protein
MSQNLEKPVYRADYTAVIWHRNESKILTLESGLPTFTSGESLYSAPYWVQDQVLQDLNLEVRVLRRISCERDPAANRARMTFELELVGDPSTIPVGARWLSSDE